MFYKNLRPADLSGHLVWVLHGVKKRADSLSMKTVFSFVTRKIPFVMAFVAAGVLPVSVKNTTVMPGSSTLHYPPTPGAEAATANSPPLPPLFPLPNVPVQPSRPQTMSAGEPQHTHRAPCSSPARRTQGAEGAPRTRPEGRGRPYTEACGARSLPQPRARWIARAATRHRQGTCARRNAPGGTR